MRFLVILAALVAVASAAGLETDPYTLSDGTVVDPTSSDTAATEERSTDSIYTTLSHDSPMAGMGHKLRQ